MASPDVAEAERCSALPPPSVGFTWPMWINQRLRWGSEKEGGMLAYLKAIKFDRERGNREPYKQWIQKRAARMWHDTFGLQAVRMSDVVYDPHAPVPDGCKNVCLIDCQLELTHFWVQIWRVDRDANLRLLWQEHVQPPGELISVAERRAFCQKRIEDKIKEYKVQPHHVAIDARHKPDLVLQWVGRNYFHGDLQMPNGRIKRGCFMTWCMLMGDKRRTWNWTLPNKQRVTRRYSEGIPMEVRVRHQGREWTLKPLLQHWSNWHIKNIADRFWRQDNAPRVEVPPQYMAEQGPESLREQMQSECVHPGKGRGGLPYWDKRHSGVFNHYWDTFCQLIVMLDKFGLLDDARMPLVAEEGESAQTEETANPEHSTANVE